MSGRLKAIAFPGPAGALEGVWKEPSGEPVGSAVFAHPHPLHGGTLHNNVVFRAARARAAGGLGTLRFNFRGAGASEGRHDLGRGEVEDFRAALSEAQRRGGLPIVAGCFSFGAAMALRAIAGDARVAAYIGVGLPVATESGQGLPLPEVPALFLVGERDTFGPPADLERFVGGSGRIVKVPGADHFFEGRLDAVEREVGSFLAGLPLPVGAR